MLDNCDNDAGDGGSVTASLVITSGTLRYVIISVAIFLSNKAEELEPAAEASEQIDLRQSPAVAEVDHVIDIIGEVGEEEDDTEQINLRQSPAVAEVDHVIDIIGEVGEEEDDTEQINLRQSPAVAEVEHGVDIIGEEDDWGRLVRIVKDKDLPSLQRLGNVDWVVWVRSFQRSYHEQGQDQIFHQHQADDVEGKAFSCYILQALNSYTIYTLFVIAGLLLAIEMIQRGPEDGWHDGVAVLVAIFVLVAFTSVANLYRERKMMKRLLNDNKKLKVTVEINGQRRSIIIYDVKERDIVHLEEGDHVPADGLFINGQELTLDDVFNSEISWDRNPFLYAGSKVMGGHGSMIVTSIGAETALGEIPSMSIQDTNAKTLLQALLDKPYELMENLALFASVMILIVVLIRLSLCKKHDSNNNGLPEMKGHLSMKFLMSVFERIFLKPEGKISSLVGALVRLVIWIQHGAPFVIGVCLTHWNTKLASKQIEPRNLSACVTMGLITVIFFDATGEVLFKPVEVEEFWFVEKEEIRSLVGSLRNAGLTIKLVSEDKFPIVRAIALDLGVLQPDGSDHDVIGDLHPKDKLRKVEQSQETGEIVAFFGGFTARDILALRKADLGITQLGRCSVMAKEFSDISLEKLSSLLVVLQYGRCVYQGIQKFYQLQLTAWIAGFLISLVSTMVSGDSPLTSLQMIWVNLILYLLGGFMMVMELKIPTNSIPEAKRNQSLITKSIWADIAIQVFYQFSLMLLIFQFKDKDMIFTIYTLCQLFNLFKVINLAKMEVVKIVLQSYWFLVALVAVLLSQFLAVQFGEGVLGGAKLTERKWTLCFLLSALSLVFDWAIKRLFFYLQQHSSGSTSLGSYFRPSNARPWCSFLVVFPFSTFVLFSASYYFHPDIARTFR